MSRPAGTRLIIRAAKSMGMVRRSNPPWWQTAASIAGFAGGFGVFYTIALALILYQAVSTASAYDLAPVCASAVDISSCRFQGPARIVRTWTNRQGDPSVDVTFAQLGGKLESATLDKAFTSQWQAWQIESEVNAELWNGRLVVVDGVTTLSNPDSFPSPLVVVTLISGAVTLPLVAVGVWWFRLSRHMARAGQSQRATDAAAHPTVTHELPLTQEMIAFLKTEAQSARHPGRTMLPILGAAALFPAVFTTVLAAQNRLSAFPVVIAIGWVVFLGVGGLIALAVWVPKVLERRDLAGGVFVRATGPFYVNVNYTKAGTFMVVTVGGKTLTGVYAKPLESIDSDIGTVDYLPVSGDLLAVQDESGQALWSRFGVAQTAQPA